MKKEIIPRPVRACLWVVIAILAAITYYIALGSPTFSMEREFRRAEKAHMVGPSEIVDILGENFGFDLMIVGETQHGICFFSEMDNSGVSSGPKTIYKFYYAEKTGDVTFVTAPNSFYFSWAEIGGDLPIYVFTQLPDAVRAELKITVSGSRKWSVNGKEQSTTFQASFTASADRTDEGFFRWMLSGENEKENMALGLLGRFGSDEILSAEDNKGSAQVQIRLYDANGNLICEENREFGAKRTEATA